MFQNRISGAGANPAGSSKERGYRTMSDHFTVIGDAFDESGGMVECHTCGELIDGALCAYANGHAYCDRHDPHKTTKQQRLAWWTKAYGQAKQNVTKIGATK